MAPPREAKITRVAQNVRTRGVRPTVPLRDLKRSRTIVCNSTMARVATEPWRPYRLSAQAPERIRDRPKGYERFGRWENVPEPDVGGA